MKKTVIIVEAITPAGTSIWTPIIRRGGKLIESMQSESDLNEAFDKAAKEHCGMDDEPSQPSVEYFDGTKILGEIHKGVREMKRVPMAFPTAWLYAATAAIVIVCVLVGLFGFK